MATAVTSADEIVVFLGPTLEQECAQQKLNAVYLPPAEQGSIYRIAQSHHPRVIVLIDGLFAKVPAVRHKEILWALSLGTRIYGASSMGALRAAELAPCGMIGHGLIYRWYRSTPFADDDEVAVAITPAELGARPLSDALINMRLTLRRGERVGVIPGEMRRALEGLAQSMHFVDRTYADLFRRARSKFDPKWATSIDPIENWVRGNAVDQKKADALSLLKYLATVELEGARPTAFRSQPTSFRLTEAWVEDLEAAGLDPIKLLGDTVVQ
jgi:hypothetical protein